MTDRKATYEELLDLLDLVTRSLVDHLKGNPSVELLSVSRGLLKHCGMFGRELDDAQRQRLQEMWTLLVDRLSEAMAQPRPPASILSEVRQLLANNGITKDLGAGIAQGIALQDLHDLDLPFTS